MRKEGNICRWFLLHEGKCCANGSLCCNPFSSEGCEILQRIVFKDETIPFQQYEPDKEDYKITKSQIFNLLDVKKGDYVGDWSIPYSEMKMMYSCPSVIISNAIKQVKNKFNKFNHNVDIVQVFHNVKLIDNTYGVYVIGVERR